MKMNRLNGKTYTQHHITWNDITRGGLLEIITSEQPKK